MAAVARQRDRAHRAGHADGEGHAERQAPHAANR
jgi:hypothetical protein